MEFAHPKRFDNDIKRNIFCSSERVLKCKASFCDRKNVHKIAEAKCGELDGSVGD